MPQVTSMPNAAVMMAVGVIDPRWHQSPRAHSALGHMMPHDGQLRNVEQLGWCFVPQFGRSNLDRHAPLFSDMRMGMFETLHNAQSVRRHSVCR